MKLLPLLLLTSCATLTDGWVKVHYLTDPPPTGGLMVCKVSQVNTKHDSTQTAECAAMPRYSWEEKP